MNAIRTIKRSERVALEIALEATLSDRPLMAGDFRREAIRLRQAAAQMKKTK